MSTIRKPIRVKARRQLGQPGPLYVPPELIELNKGFHLYWGMSSPQDSYSLLELRRKGYNFVPASQLKEISDKLGDGGNLAHTYTEGDYICTGTGNGSKSYLMRISLEKKAELDKEFVEDIRDNQGRVELESMDNPNIYKKKELYDN